MAGIQEIPEITTELLDMSREYLRQETVEPLKRVGKHAGLRLGGAAIISTGSFLTAWAIYYGLVALYPEGDWYVVLARVTTGVVAASAAGIVAWRMQSDH
jgi:hypothetical protein